MTELQLIHNKVNKYLRKFYLFRLFRGLIFSIALLAFIYLIIIGIEYFYFLSVPLKKILFFSYLVVILAVFVEFIFIPIFKIFKVFPVLNNFEAASAISNKIPELKDVLVNLFELEKLNTTNSSLIQASIKQKTQEIKFFNFSNAIKFSELRSYIKYLAFPLLIFLFIFIFNKSILKDGSSRFLNYSVSYEKQAPFEFILMNDNLVVQSGSDFTVRLSVSGDFIPNVIYLNFGSNRIPMISSQNSKTTFEYTFKSINNNFSFNFDADGFNSKYFELSVLPSPSILDFSINVVPPPHTSKPPFKIVNSGDLIVPFGSKLNYQFLCSQVDTLSMVFDSTIIMGTVQDAKFFLTYTALKSLNYSVLVKNSFFTQKLFKYSLSVIPDLYPNIHVDAIQDSVNFMLFYYRGQIADDYGFRSVTFNYQIVSKNHDVLDYENFISTKIDFSPHQLNQDFYYLYNFNDFQLSSDSLVKYFFEVVDNDAVSGFKSVRTSVFSFYLPSLNDLDSAFNALDNEVQDKLNSASQLSLQIQNDIDDFQQKMLNEDVEQWEKENFLENLLQKQNDLEKLVDSLSKDNQQKLNDLQAFDPQNEELLQKHEELQKLINELFTDEMKQMLEQLKDLQKQFDNQNFEDMLDQNKMNFEDLSDELDRSTELLKRMQIEQNLQNTIDKLDELSKKQNDLANSFQKDRDISSEKQDSVLTNEFEFDEIMNEYDSLRKQNQELEEPYNLDDFQEEIDQINQDFDATKEQMFKDNNKKSSDNLQQSGENMQELSKKMSSMMQQNSMQQNSEDIQAIKFLLTNLLSFSFSQEDVNNITLKKFSTLSERYLSLKVSQLLLTNQFNIISDSLNALAMRNPMIGKVITDELHKIRQNLLKSNKSLEENKRNIASISQRNILTSVNKLALMLQESLSNMQGQMSMSGSGKPKKGGNSTMPSVGDMKQLQQGLQQQLQDMIDKMQGGQKPGSMQMGQQIAKREALQKMLQDMMNGSQMTDEMKEILQQISELNEQIKQNILNNNITPELLLKENEIRTRMLEVESSDNKRKFSNKRKSQTTDNIINPTSDEIEEFFSDYELVNENFTIKNILLTPFYKNFYNEYIYRLGQK